MREYTIEQARTVHERMVPNTVIVRPVRYRGDKQSDGVDAHFLSTMVPALPNWMAEDAKSKSPKRETVEAVNHIQSCVRRYKKQIATKRYAWSPDIREANEFEVRIGSLCCRCDTFGVMDVSGFDVCVNCGELA